MKKFLFISAVLIIFSTLATAQEGGYIRKGMSRLSGAAAFSWNHQSLDETNGGASHIDSKTLQFSLSPSYSRLITNNLELGGVFSFMYNKYDTEFSFPDNSIKNSSYYLSIGVGPAVRYFFTADNMVPFVGVSYLFSYSGQQGVGSKETMTNLNMGAGLDYFISDNTAIEPSITYAFYWYESGTMNRLNIGVGINYFIK